MSAGGVQYRRRGEKVEKKREIEIGDDGQAVTSINSRMSE